MTPPSPTAHRLSAAARREQLLDVTTRLAAERGFHAISIEAVSARAGVTRALVYNHFRDLNQLLEAVVEREIPHAKDAKEVVRVELPSLHVYVQGLSHGRDVAGPGLVSLADHEIEAWIAEALT